MNNKTRQQKSANIADINKQILEIKKKIQLSEGQRKALFEVREAECKANSDEILKLKKEISQLALTLRENRSTSAKCRVKSSRLQSTMGPLSDKSCSEAQELLDLQIIDKNKQLDLLRFRVQKKQNYLTQLANEYQVLVSEKGTKEVIRKVDNPIKSVTSELQNNIHAVKIQWRGALHVFNRYQDIKKSLQQDAARFEFNIKCAEEQLHIQAGEIERLQKIAEEASEMRGTARAALLQQEKAALNAAKARDQQETEGKRLVMRGKQELEKLERRIFQSGRAPVRSEADTGDENQTGQEGSIPPPQSEEGMIIDLFETLKQATGSTSPEEVLEHYRSQRDTDDRLNRLRNAAEIEKRQLEKLQESLTSEFERYKYAEAKDAEQNLEDVERLHNSIEEQKQLEESYYEAREKIKTVMESICKSLNGIYLAIHPLAAIEPDALTILKLLEEELQAIMAELEQTVEKEPQIERLDIDEEKWLPPPYSGLVRRTPVPQDDASPIPPAAGSEDEEEVPTRGYLKRQAQLVVDARARRKNVRMQRK